MSSTFPCPNPSCTHTFTREAVRGTPELVCPRCRSVFRFQSDPEVRPSATPRPRPRARGPATPTPQRKAAPPPLPVLPPKAPPPPPPAPPVPPSPVVAAPAHPPVVPLAMPVEAPAAPLDFGGEPGALVTSPRARRPRGKGGVFKWLMVLFFGGGTIAALALGAYLGIREGWFSGWWEGDDFGAAAEQANFRFRLPEPPWSRDRELERRVGANLALSRPGPRVEAALFFRDFQTRNATRAELVDEAVERLRHSFDGVEYELQEEPGRLGGEEAVALEFRGEDREEKVFMRGECYAVARRGYSYWFLTWGPERDREEVWPQAAEVRGRLAFLGGREGWTEKARETEPLREGEESPIRYRLDYAKAVWEEVPREGYDPFADRVLLGNDPKRERYARDAATAQVVILPGQRTFAEGVQAARDHFLTGQKKLYPETTLEPIKDGEKKAFDRAQDIGNARGHLVKWHVLNDESRQRFAVLAIVPRKHATLAVVCECDWTRREFWDLEFMALIDRFRLVLD